MFLIAGHGLAGSLLAHALLQRGCAVTVFDPGGPNATTTASGVLNPITGRRLTRAWNLETFLPAALGTYRALEIELGIPLLEEISALWLHASPEEFALFAARAEADPALFESEVNSTACNPFFHLRESLGRIHPVFRLDVSRMLNGLRERLKKQGALVEEVVEVKSLALQGDELLYRETAISRLVFCEGAAAVNNPYFQNLPWSPAAGEALILSIPDLPRDAVYKLGFGLSLSPWPAQQPTSTNSHSRPAAAASAPEPDTVWWLGSNYLWDTLKPSPTASFHKHCEVQLKAWLKLPYEVLEHRVGVRPATVDRKPFVGFHPSHPRIGIFNGLGAKGILMAPFLAANFAQHITEGTPLMREADIVRHRRALLR